MFTATLLLLAPRLAVLGACLGLAAVVMLFIFYIQPDASDLAPHRTNSINFLNAIAFTRIFATLI